MKDYREIEAVTINDMKMYKVEDRIFLSMAGAKQAIARGEFNDRTEYGYSHWDDYDPIEICRNGGWLHGIKL